MCRRQAGLPADLSRRYRLEKHAPIEHFPFPAQDLCYRLGYRNRQEGMEASHSRHHRQGQFIGTGPSSRPFLPLYASTNINHMQRQENLLQRYSSQNEINDVTSSTNPLPREENKLHDFESVILFWDTGSIEMNYPKESVGESQPIKAATLEALINHLFSSNCDIVFFKTFILTYRSFTKPEAFFQVIKQWFPCSRSLLFPL